MASASLVPAYIFANIIYVRMGAKSVDTDQTAPTGTKLGGD